MPDDTREDVQKKREEKAEWEDRGEVFQQSNKTGSLRMVCDPSKVPPIIHGLMDKWNTGAIDTLPRALSLLYEELCTPHQVPIPSEVLVILPEGGSVKYVPEEL